VYRILVFFLVFLLPGQCFAHQILVGVGQKYSQSRIMNPGGTESVYMGPGYGGHLAFRIRPSARMPSDDVFCYEFYASGLYQLLGNLAGGISENNTRNSIGGGLNFRKWVMFLGFVFNKNYLRVGTASGTFNVQYYSYGGSTGLGIPFSAKGPISLDLGVVIETGSLSLLNTTRRITEYTGFVSLVIRLFVPGEGVKSGIP